MRFLSTTTEFANIAGVPARTVQRWVATGVIKPVKVGRGKGKQHVFAILDVLRVVLARDLRRRGFALGEAATVLSALDGVPLERLQAEWAAGRTHLVIIGERCIPWLVAPDAIPANDVAAANAAGLRTAAINVEGCFAQLCSELDARARQPAKERKPA